MYQLALCDDNSAELDKIEHMLRSYEKQDMEIDFCIRQFQSTEELLDKIEDGAYLPDILFLDIYMPGRSGMDLAKRLRKMGNDFRIIFITSSREHALEAFQVEAVQYLVKPISEEKLGDALDKIFGELDKERLRYILLKTDERIHRVAVSDIVYCEAERKKQHVHLKDRESIRLRMTMAKLCEMFSQYKEFAKVGVSYLVNLEHIEGLGTQALQMDNGDEIYLPRGSYKTLREKYFDYYFRGTV